MYCMWVLNLSFTRETQRSAIIWIAPRTGCIFCGVKCGRMEAENAVFSFRMFKILQFICRLNTLDEESTSRRKF